MILTVDNTSVIMDFEGVFFRENLLYYILRLYPLLTVKSVLRGFNDSCMEVIKSMTLKNFMHNLIKTTKSSYESKIDNGYMKNLGGFVYEMGRRCGVEDLIHILEDDGWEYRIVTSAHREFPEGFFEKLPKELAVSQEKIIGTTNNKFIGMEEKKEIAIQLKKQKGYLVGLGDSNVDSGLLGIADLPFVIRTKQYYLTGCRAPAYPVRSLKEFKDHLDAICYRECVG